MKKVLIVSLAVTLISFAGFSQNIDREKLDAYFNTLFEHNRFMGSVAIARGSELIYSKSVGFADVEQGIKIDENTKFRIASISKTFTAVLILKAVEENRLTLCQTIDKWFPEIGNADKITVEHLLRHQSGLYEFLGGYGVFSGRIMQPKTEQEIIEIIKKGRSNFEPGAQTVYNNSGFLLLTFILERIYEKSFAELVKEKIANPIGLKNTRLGGRINSQNNESHSYTFHRDWQQADEADISQLLGTGGIVSTPTDLVKFSHALFSGKLLSENSLQQMKTMQEDCQRTRRGFGMGLTQISFHHRIGHGHGGGIDAFSSMFAYLPDGEISFAVISNARYFNFTDNINLVLLNAAYNMPFDIPEFITFDTSDIDLDKFVGVYASAQSPSQMTITNVDNQLFAQMTGQPSFPLGMTGENQFENRQVGLVLEFNPENKTVIFRQFGIEVHFECKMSFEIPELVTLDTSDTDLNQFVGVYSSAQIPLQMTITNVDNQLFAQMTGQPSFPLGMTGENQFENRPMGLVLEFNPENKTVIFRQFGMEVHFERE